VLVREVYHEGPQAYTLLLSVSGAGSVFGALIVAGLGHIKQKDRIALVMLGCLGILIVALALSRSLIFSACIIFLTGAALISVFSLVSSLVQLLVEDQMRGRVMSVYNVAFRGGMPIGSLISGALIQKFSAPPVLAVNGALLALFSMGLLFQHRRMENLIESKV
jgi:predicted MFS family arabinose efflux permease